MTAKPTSASAPPAGRLFGTDGIRGRFGDGWLTPARVSALGRAVGRVLARHGERHGGRALLGHDGRRSGPVLEAALARGLASTGHTVESTGLIPTPGLAVLGRLRGYDLAAMISASHNPAEDNGIKLFGPSGEKLADALEDEIETELRAHLEPVEEGPRPAVDPALETVYLEHLLAAADGLSLDGLALVVDCANGGASRIAPRVLGRLGAHVVTISSDPDGANINQDCGSTHPRGLQEAVRLHGADAGIALDGDGDRCLLVDERGALVDGDGILTIVARDRAAAGTLPGARVVATVMSNLGLHRALREAGIGVVTVGVGDRRVVEALRREALGLGGEQSGHIVFGAENGYVGDGLLTALRVLDVLVRSEQRLSTLAGAFRSFPQVLVNVTVERKPPLETLPALQELVRRVEADLGDEGRVLLRYSGTEPLARVMVEGPDEEDVRARAREIATAVARELGAPGGPRT